MLKEFQRIGRFLFAEGLVDSHGGNLSLRQGDKFFITRSGAMLGDLNEGDVVEVDLNETGEVGNIHRAIYKNCGAQAIVHAHPANAIALSITDNKIIPQDTEGLNNYKAAAIVRVRDSAGAEETVRLLPSFLGGGNVIAVVKAHGSFAIGQSLEEAYKFTSALENSCKIIVAVRSSSASKKSEAPSRPMHGPGRGREKSAIPPGIGVMDRSRYRNR